jgi:hypothetical protein
MKKGWMMTKDLCASKRGLPADLDQDSFFGEGGKKGGQARQVRKVRQGKGRGL